MKTFSRIIFICAFLSYSISVLYAQTGGQNEYKFLSLTNSARVAGMGGNFLAIHDNDLSLALANPSIISPSMHNNLSLNFTDYFAGSHHGFVSYGYHLDKPGTLVASLQYISYGKFDGTNEIGQQNGQFSAGEYAFNVGWGRMLDSVFSIGANVKAIYSSLDSYNSFGMAVDVAGSYVPNESFCASLVLRNIGKQLSTYSGAETQPLPFEIQAGISKRLAHMPFRYSIVLQHLEKWDLTTADQNQNVDPFTGEAESKSRVADFSNKFFSHVVIGGEFIPARFLSIRLGYNYLRRQELKVASRTGTSGFSIGLGIKVSKFSFSYTRAAYHLAGSPNYISIGTNLGDWR